MNSVRKTLLLDVDCEPQCRDMLRIMVESFRALRLCLHRHMWPSLATALNTVITELRKEMFRD